MKRWIFPILLGALANVAVAWACATWSTVTVAHADGMGVEDADVPFGWAEDASPLPRGFMHLSVEHYLGRQVRNYYWISDGIVSRSTSFPVVCEVRAGWPIPCLSGGVADLEFRLDYRPMYAIVFDPEPVALMYYDPTLLPVRPIFLGFFINTLFFAVVLWLPLRGPLVLRRHIRLKRGRCPKCGYDLRGQPPDVGAGGGCPECGWNRQPEPAAGGNAV